MKIIKLEYSKSAIRKAGKVLISDKYSFDEYFDSFVILDNWRLSHEYPLQSMLGYFRKRAFEVDKNAIVVRRLKRLPSIMSKLRRESGMKLDRIEDIGGCRIVVSNLKNVLKIRDNIVNGRTRNKLVRERNYLTPAKPSGYRGIHLVYQYNGSKKNFHGHRVELQIRSKIQHSWATAVEVVGTFTRQGLKASQGESEWLEFFKLASIAFEDIETNRLIANKNSIERIRLLELIDNIKVLPRINAFAVSTKHLNHEKTSHSYFLLILDVEESSIEVRMFMKSELERAAEQYKDLEEQNKKNSSIDVVLVSAESVRGLKKAYPNYFADTSEFIKNLTKVIEAK